jgi:DNA-binding NarL/FixJ family response regulator
MTVPRILIVDDQREVTRLLRSALEALEHNLEVLETPSGEEAILEASRKKIDLLVADYRLPGITGLELMERFRGRNPELKVILITGVADDKVRLEVSKAGASAFFTKPVPMADFLDAVERCLGLARTILPAETMDELEQQRKNLSGLLSNFRQRQEALAVFLLSDRGRVLVRAGELPDSSMEVSMLSALMAIYSAGQKVSRAARQEATSGIHIFRGSDYDLVFSAVNAVYALLVAGRQLSTSEKLPALVDTLASVRGEVERLLQSMGVAAAPETGQPAAEVPDEQTGDEAASADVEALFRSAGKARLKPEDIEAFWNAAMEGSQGPPTNPDVLTYDQARQLGLAPGEDE